jgi:hypothetical protein
LFPVHSFPVDHLFSNPTKAFPLNQWFIAEKKQMDDGVELSLWKILFRHSPADIVVAEALFSALKNKAAAD